MKSLTMILDLAKRYVFNREYDQYNVEYEFTKEKKDQPDVCLTMNASLNREAIQTLQINKPTSILYQSNEVIEKMIEEEMVAFYTKTPIK